MKSGPLTIFGASMASISATLTACPHPAPTPPPPLEERTAADVAAGLDIAATVSELVLKSDAVPESRMSCIIGEALPASLRGAANGVRAAAATPELPGLYIDVSACGRPENFPIPDDAGPWIALWGNMVELVRLQVISKGKPETCAARAAGEAVLHWLGEDLGPEIALELVESTADGIIQVETKVISWSGCE